MRPSMNNGQGQVNPEAILVWCANFSTICCVPKLPAQRKLHDCHWRAMGAPTRLGD